MAVWLTLFADHKEPETGQLLELPSPSGLGRQSPTMSTRAEDIAITIESEKQPLITKPDRAITIDMVGGHQGCHNGDVSGRPSCHDFFATLCALVYSLAFLSEKPK